MGNKYNARRSGGYDSQLEKKYSEKLELLVKSGDVVEFVHHPPSIKMVGGITWNVDYWVKLADGDECYVEVKGYPDKVFPLKWRLYKWLYNRGNFVEFEYLPCMVVMAGGTVWDSVGCEDILRLNIL